MKINQNVRCLHLKQTYCKESLYDKFIGVPIINEINNIQEMVSIKITNNPSYNPIVGA